VLYQNDDFGKDYLIGLREGLSDKADKMIVAIKTYETTDPTVDSQVVALRGSDADVLLTAAVPKFAAQAIRKVYLSAGSRCTSSPTYPTLLGR
jgi:branched-chain amino acid transport system substrate-binding protein